MTEPTFWENAGSFVRELTRSEMKIFLELQEALAHQESNLAWYHRTGTKLLELQGTIEKREPGWRQKVAAALGISLSAFTKMRKFANDFTESQAQHLDEKGCNWTMVTVVQHVRTDCMKLLEESLAKNWTVTELQAAVKQRFGVSNPGGRPLRKPGTRKQGLQQLQALGEKWLKYYEEVWASGDDSLNSRLRDMDGKGLQTVSALLPGVRQTMQRMQKVVQALDKFLGELEQKAKLRKP